MDKWNWAKCDKVEGLNDAMRGYDTWWTGFWAQEGAMKIMLKNMEGHEKELDKVQLDLIDSWESQNYKQAGEDWARMYEILLGSTPQLKVKAQPVVI